MNPRLFHTALAGILLALFCHSSGAQVPQLLNYQGRVVVSGTNFDGSGQFKFALVSGSFPTTTLWSNDGSSTAGSAPSTSVSLPVAKGLYSVLLGDATLPNMTAVPASVFNNNDVRLRVWLNDGSHGWQQLSPDQRIAAVGYAMMASNAVTAGTASTVVDGSITSAKFAPGTTFLASGGTASTISGTIPASQVSGLPSTLPATGGTAATISGTLTSANILTGTGAGAVVSGTDERLVNAEQKPQNVFSVMFRAEQGQWSNSCYPNFDVNVTQGFSRKMWVTPLNSGVRDLSLTYENFNLAEVSGSNAVTVTASIEYPPGTVTQVFFNGQSSGVISPGARLHSDPCPVEIPANTVAWVRTYVTVPAGGVWPVFQAYYNGLGGSWITYSEYVVSGTAGIADQTLTTGTEGMASNSGCYGFWPTTVRGTLTGTCHTSIGIVGDSIAYQGYSFAQPYLPMVSFLTESLQNKYPVYNTARPGNSVSEAVTKTMLSASVAESCTHVICQLGANDIRAYSPDDSSGVDALKANYLKLWTFFANRGIKVYQTTLTPNTTSSDNFRTQAGQTIVSGTTLTLINDWIRTTPAPLSGYIETADAVMDHRNSNTWKTNGTDWWMTGPDYNGLHPNAGGHEAMKAVINDAIDAGMFQ